MFDLKNTAKTLATNAYNGAKNDINSRVNDTISDMKGIFGPQSKDMQRAMKPINNGFNFAGKTVTKASGAVAKKLVSAVKKGLTR